MRPLYCAGLAICLALSGRAATAPEIRNAIRSDKLDFLRSLSRQDLTETRDHLGWTPLHDAALYGSGEAFRIVLEAGADPDAHTQSGATPLMLAAWSLERTRLLVEKGGDVNAKANSGITPLWVALGSPGNEQTARYLIEKGADTRYVMPNGADYLIRAAATMNAELIRMLLEKGIDPRRADKAGVTALLNAYRSGSPGVPAMLIAAGADVNAATTDAGSVKNGPIDSFGLTPLMAAAELDDPAAISALLHAGAKADATDHRHMTALMMAVATDQANPANVRRLIQAGADVNVKDRYGETALDWARKYRNPEIIAVLEKAGASEKGLPPAPRKNPDYRPDAREALTQSAALLAKSSETFFPAGGGCVGCHHQPFAGRAFAALKSAGLPAEPRLRRTLIDSLVPDRIRNIDRLPLLAPGAGGLESFLYPLAALAEMGEPANDFTDAMVHYVAETQHPSGAWGAPGARPPLQSSQITKTMLAIGALKNYGWPARQSEFNERIARARKWLMQARAWTINEEADRILGLSLAGASAADLQEFSRKLIAQQRADGGWAQTTYLDSDAFGTSAVLYSLRRAGLLAVSDPAYRRGAQYLLDTQFPDGSWYVRSRAVKLQPYFQSAFPFNHDQWISNSATAYAVMALAPAAVTMEQSARK